MNIRLTFIFPIVLFLFSCSNPNALDEAGNSSLHHACKAEDLPKVKTLIESGAELNLKGKNDQTALYLACLKRNYEISQLLLTSGADANAKNNQGWTPLISVSYDDQYNLARSLKLAQLLLDHGADINAKDNEGSTVLHHACSKRPNNQDNHDFTKMITLLLDNGADVNVVNSHQYTPLHIVTFNNNAVQMELLISKGADVNARASTFDTPLVTAVRKSYYESVECLIKHNVDVNQISRFNKTALDNANWLLEKVKTPEEKEQAQKIKDLLLKHGAKTSADLSK